MEQAPDAATTSVTPSDDNKLLVATLKASQVEGHKTYDDLVDIVKDSDIDSFLETTLVLANSHDEEWRKQYDALDNLRILNKFYFDVLE